jgi:hypothetical protein
LGLLKKMDEKEDIRKTIAKLGKMSPSALRRALEW